MADGSASAATRGSMTALATFGVVQLVDTDELGMDEWNDDELRDTITNLELNRLVLIQVDQRHLDLASVPRVDGSGSVDDGQTGTDGKPRPGVDEPHMPIGDGDSNAGGDESALPRPKNDVFPTTQVGSRVSGQCVARQRRVIVNHTGNDHDASCDESARHREQSRRRASLICMVLVQPTGSMPQQFGGQDRASRFLGWTHITRRSPIRIGAMKPEKIAWKIYASAIGAVTTLVSQKLVEGAWRYVTGDDEPPSAEDPEETTGRALSWAVASGLGVAGAQLIARRFTNRRWMKYSLVNPVTGKKVGVRRQDDND